MPSLADRVGSHQDPRAPLAAEVIHLVEMDAIVDETGQVVVHKEPPQSPYHDGGVVEICPV